MHNCLALSLTGKFVTSVKSTKGFEDIPFKIAVEENQISFLKLAIKVKKQIVADGLNNNEYDVTNVETFCQRVE